MILNLKQTNQIYETITTILILNQSSNKSSKSKKQWYSHQSFKYGKCLVLQKQNKQNTNLVCDKYDIINGESPTIRKSLKYSFIPYSFQKTTTKNKHKGNRKKKK